MKTPMGETTALPKYTAEKADKVRELLKRKGASRPFWTTTSGKGIKPFINIVCQDLEMLHALDDFLKACVTDAKL